MFNFHLLYQQAHPNSYALVLSTENQISSLYRGNNPSMLLVNCLFRMGGSAALLSSHPSDRYRSKYQLIHTLRTHVGADENSYKCVIQAEDSEQKVGVSLSKDLMNVARDALKVHITSLGPLVLPVSEKLKFVVNVIQRKLFKKKVVFALSLKHIDESATNFQISLYSFIFMTFSIMYFLFIVLELRQMYIFYHLCRLKLTCPISSSRSTTSACTREAGRFSIGCRRVWSLMIGTWSLRE